MLRPRPRRSRRPGRFSSTRRSLPSSYGLAGAAAALVLAAPLAYLATRYPSRLSIALERIAYLAQGVPAIVVALAFISLTVQTVRPLYQSAGAAGDRLCDSVSAVRSGRRPLGAGAGPARARGGGPLARARVVRGRCAGPRAAGGTGRRRRSRDGVRFRRHRVDGDPVARADRHAHAGHRGLGEHDVAGLCRGRAVRGDDAG